MNRSYRRWWSPALERDMELLVVGHGGTPVRVFPTSLGRFYRRAMRGGMDAQLIDFGRSSEVPMRELAVELLEFVDDVVDGLGSRREVGYLETIGREGTSADRQLRTYAQTAHLHRAVDEVARETLEGVPELSL